MGDLSSEEYKNFVEGYPSGPYFNVSLNDIDNDILDDVLAMTDFQDEDSEFSQEQLNSQLYLWNNLLKKETDQTKREKWKKSLQFWVEKDDESPERPTLFFRKQEPTAFAKRVVDAVNNSILMGKPVQEMKEKPNFFLEFFNPHSDIFKKTYWHKLVQAYVNEKLDRNEQQKFWDRYPPNKDILFQNIFENEFLPEKVKVNEKTKVSEIEFMDIYNIYKKSTPQSISV
jgi:hypothetical protein